VKLGTSLLCFQENHLQKEKECRINNLRPNT